MITNKIKKRIDQLKLYDAVGNQTMLSKEHIEVMIEQIPANDLLDPNTTYCDPQCGTGTVLLVLTYILMKKLENHIPDELDRFNHIVSKQIFGSDISKTQVLLASSNFKRAIQNNKLECNFKVLDCFKNHEKYSYVISNTDFETIKNFVPKFRKQCKKLIITGRANKNCYTDSRIYELSGYQYLSKTRTDTLLCLMIFEPKKENKTVKIIGENFSINVDDPPFLPDHDIKLYQYALEVLQQNFTTYSANYGSYYRTSDKLKTKGTVPLIFNVGKYNEDFSDILYAQESVITKSEGVGLHKIVISKNGIHRHQSPIKYAGPKFGTGHNTLWVQIESYDEFAEFFKYYTSEPIVALCKAIKSTMPANGTKFWQRIPKYEYFDKIKTIYEKYYG